MTKIVMRRRTVPNIGELRTPAWLCTTVERPDADVSTIKERPGVFPCHARVRNMRPDQIMDFLAVFSTQDKPPSHEITIRYPPDVKVDIHHWIYTDEGDAQVWYKVQSVEGHAQRFLFLNCSIDTINDVRTDPATQRPPPAWETPEV